MPRGRIDAVRRDLQRLAQATHLRSNAVQKADRAVLAQLVARIEKEVPPKSAAERATLYASLAGFTALTDLLGTE